MNNNKKVSRNLGFQYRIRNESREVEKIVLSAVNDTNEIQSNLSKNSLKAPAKLIKNDQPKCSLRYTIHSYYIFGSFTFCCEV